MSQVVSFLHDCRIIAITCRSILHTHNLAILPRGVKRKLPKKFISCSISQDLHEAGFISPQVPRFFSSSTSNVLFCVCLLRTEIKRSKLVFFFCIHSPLPFIFKCLSSPHKSPFHLNRSGRGWEDDERVKKG